MHSARPGNQRWAEATASLLPAELASIAQRLLDRRYGLVMRLYRAYVRRRSPAAETAYVAIEWTANGGIRQ